MWAGAGAGSDSSAARLAADSTAALIAADQATAVGHGSAGAGTVFSVPACNTLVTSVTLRCLKGQTKIRNFIIKPLITLMVT